MSCIRAVRRAKGRAIASPNRSAKICRGQSGSGHRNRRTVSLIRTRRPCAGRSARQRSYRLWTRSDRPPQDGHLAAVACERATATISAIIDLHLLDDQARRQQRALEATSAHWWFLLYMEPHRRAKPQQLAPRLSQSPDPVPVDIRAAAVGIHQGELVAGFLGGDRRLPRSAPGRRPGISDTASSHVPLARALARQVPKGAFSSLSKRATLRPRARSAEATTLKAVVLPAPPLKLMKLMILTGCSRTVRPAPGEGLRIRITESR